MPLLRSAGMLVFSIFLFKTPAEAQTAEQLVGKWGIAAYWKTEDAKKARIWAKEACGHPYGIGKGATPDTVNMHIADDPEPHTLHVREQAGSIHLVQPDGEAAGDEARHLRRLSGWDDRSFEVHWVAQETASRYGIHVYMRCI